MSATPLIGAMRERIQVRSKDPVSAVVSSLTRTSSVATAATVSAHGFVTGDRVTLSGCTPDAYNGTVAVTVTGPTGFTFAISGSPSSPASGAMRAEYAGDAMGGRRETWWTLADLWAEYRPGPVSERLQAGAVRGEALATFRVWKRPDVTRTMRIQWGARTFEIVGVSPLGTQWMLIDGVEGS